MGIYRERLISYGLVKLQEKFNKADPEKLASTEGYEQLETLREIFNDKKIVEIVTLFANRFKTADDSQDAFGGLAYADVLDEMSTKFPEHTFTSNDLKAIYLLLDSIMWISIDELINYYVQFENPENDAEVGTIRTFTKEELSDFEDAHYNHIYDFDAATRACQEMIFSSEQGDFFMEPIRNPGLREAQIEKIGIDLSKARTSEGEEMIFLNKYKLENILKKMARALEVVDQYFAGKTYIEATDIADPEFEGGITTEDIAALNTRLKSMLFSDTPPAEIDGDYHQFLQMLSGGLYHVETYDVAEGYRSYSPTCRVLVRMEFLHYAGTDHDPQYYVSIE